MEHEQPATPRVLNVELIDLITGTMVLSIGDGPLAPVSWPERPATDAGRELLADAPRVAGRIRTCRQRPTGGLPAV